MELTLAFLSSRFLRQLKKSGQKFKYLKKERAFKMKKVFFIVIKGFPSEKIKPTIFGREDSDLKLYYVGF